MSEAFYNYLITYEQYGRVVGAVTLKLLTHISLQLQGLQKKITGIK